MAGSLRVVEVELGSKGRGGGGGGMREDERKSTVMGLMSF
jgi:hypothetical protein